MNIEVKTDKTAIIHVIDQGTVYDVPGKLRKLATDIESGRYGEVRECVLGIREYKPDGNRKTTGFWFGTGSFDGAVTILERIKKDLLG